MPHPLKHTVVSRKLLEEIASGKYNTDRRLPSEAELVGRFKLSRPTISRALRDLEASGVIVRRPGSGTYLKDEMLTDARASIKRLDLIFPDLPQVEIFEEIGGALAGLARVQGFQMPWDGRESLEALAKTKFREVSAWCDEALQRGSRGVFFAPMENLEGSETANRQIADRLRQAGVPMVLIDRDYLPFPARSEFDLVAVDHFRGAYMLAEHLIKLGCHRLGFVRKPNMPTTIDMRILGARAALTAYGMEAPPDFVQTGDPTNAAFLRGLTAGGRFDAAICANDRIAAQVLQGLSKLNIKAPQDLRLTGFDDLRYATLLSVPLTTIHHPCREIAITAFKAMIERIADPTLPPRHIHLTPSLVVRESCGAYLTRSGDGTARRRR